MMKVEIIRKEIIKPSSPTPPHLKKMMLSLLDQLAPAVYVPIVLFFRPPPHTGDDHMKKFTEMSQCLRKSLSETLSLFFRVAGRFKDNVSIDCNDEGVEYFEARVDCLLEDVLENPENDVLNGLVAVAVDNAYAVERCQLLIQINLFNCGGIAIGASFWHKVFDTSALATFLKAWSAAALKTQGEEKTVIAVPPPDFTTPALAFPPVKEIPMSWDVLARPVDKNVVKVFKFDASKLTEVRSKAAISARSSSTRVEAVSALIWKCTMTASEMKMSNLEGKKSYVVGSAMNLRKRLVPPLPENTMGNVTAIFTAQSEGSDDLTDLGTLSSLLRKELMEACDFFKTVGGENGNAGIFELAGKVGNKVQTCHFLTYSSWCKFPFYEVEFGWGKPTWVGVPINPYGDSVVLIDSKDGAGVDAYVSLSPEEMAVFERDPEFLAFASVKTNV